MLMKLSSMQFIDEEEDNHANDPSHLHMASFPSQTIIKLNMLAEIYAGNYDSQDGLVNGADGTSKPTQRQVK